MQTEKTENLSQIGEMKKRRVRMADGRRYLIYYTFENQSFETTGEPNDCKILAADFAQTGGETEIRQPKTEKNKNV